MNWILLVMGGIAAVVIAMLLGGAMAPRVRLATRRLAVPRTAEAVFPLLRAVDGPPRWCPDLPTMQVVSEHPPHALTLMLADDDGRDVGRWTISVAPPGAESAGGNAADTPECTVTITEAATVNNLLLRFLRTFGGNGARPQRFLEAVATQLQVPADIR